MSKLEKAIDRISQDFGSLFVTFCVLKLTDLIDWSWWWVFSPLWIFALAFALTMFAVVAVLIVLSLWPVKNRNGKHHGHRRQKVKRDDVDV